MMPLLASFGPLKLYAYGVVLCIGLFLSLYWWWKMGRDEHWDEVAMFDGFFLALLVYLIVGRLAFVATHLSDLNTFSRAIALLSYPGINGVVGIVASLAFVILFGRKRDWQLWKVLDVSVVTLSLVLVFGALAYIFNTGPSWFVGTWVFAWSLITFATVSRVRKNFRFYAWYKGEAKVAQEGLAALTFTLLTGVHYLMMGLLQPSVWRLWVIPGECVAGLWLIVMSMYLIYARTGQRVNLLQWLRKRG